MAVISGPNALLRCLRAQDDPVSPGGSKKLELATSTWRDTSVVIPHKAAILRDWLLDICMKDTTPIAESPLLQQGYLDLLLSVCSTMGLGISPRLLCRFFGILATHPVAASLTSHSVWSLEPDQTGAMADVWLETWASMVAVLSLPEAAATFSTDLIRLVEQHVDRYLTEGIASKKVFAALPSTLPLLARAIALHVPLRPETTGAVLFPPTAQMTGQSTKAVLAALPGTASSIQIAQHILRSYHAAIYNHRFDIFIQPTSSHIPHASYINEKLRAATRKAFSEIQAWSSSVPRQTRDTRAAYWESKTECWKAISEWSSYLETDTEWTRMLAQDADLAKGVIREDGDSRLCQASLALLNVLENLDHVATALDIGTLAWCIKVPSGLLDDALALMTSSFRFHHLSQTESLWVTSVLDAVQSLLSSAPDRGAAEAIHEAVSSGPMWSLAFRQQIGRIRKVQPVCELLVQRTKSLSSADPYCVVVLSVISHFVATVGFADPHSSEETMTAMQRVIDQLATTSSASAAGSSDSLYAIGISAVIRVGRTINPSTRERLGQAYGLLDWNKNCQHAELRREIVLWLLSCLTDDPVNSGPILDHLVLAVQSSPASNVAEAFSTSDLAVIHELATPAQLEALMAALISSKTTLDWTRGSAGISDLSDANGPSSPRDLASLVDASLRLLLRDNTVNAGADLLSSLPISNFDRALRSRIIDALTTIDNNGNAAVQSVVRIVLARLPSPDLSKLPENYLTHLEIGLSLDSAQTTTRLLVQAVARARIDSDHSLPFSSFAAQVLSAEVAMERDFTQLAPPLCGTLETLAKSMLSTISPQHTPETRVIIAKFALWCGVSDVEGIANLWTRGGTMAGSAKCEMLRLMCIDNHDRARYLQYLLQRSSLLASDVIDHEIRLLGRQRDAYPLLLAVCLEQTKAPATRHVAYHAIMVLLSTRTEGSGKAIVELRQPLIKALFRPAPGLSSPPSQTGAIHALVKYRAKLLRVTDVARILDDSTCLTSLDMIGVVYALTTLRGELLVDVIPQLAGFLCRQLTQVAADLVVPLGRLLSALSQTRRHRQPARQVPLVNALSKHAPAIVTAYVRGWANPRCEIPIVQRRVLQASIYNWCDIIVRGSHRGREGEGVGQPFGLGEAGAVESELWAELWTQWGRQRYRGQG